MVVYYTHDNGGRPYKVRVDDANKILKVYTEIHNDDNDHEYEKKHHISLKFKKLFVGKSPKTRMTEFSGGIGFTGNSLLLDVGRNIYVFIGERIIRFTNDVPIVKFVSPVGNSDVPYPYAIDDEGNILFILEMKKYNYVKYDKKMFDCPTDFIYFKKWIHIRTENYDKFKLYDKNNNLYNFRYYRKKYYVDDVVKSKKEYLALIDKLLPKSKNVKYVTLLKRVL